MTNTSPCACIGPLYNEPHCYCVMVAKGLPLNDAARAKAEAELKDALADFFNWKARKAASLHAPTRIEERNDDGLATD